MLTVESLRPDFWYPPPPVDVEHRTRSCLKSDHIRKEDRVQPVQSEVLKNSRTFNIVRLLKTCKDLSEACRLHAYVREHEFIEKNCYIASTLVSMFASCGALAKAQQVLDELPVGARDVVVWTALIAGYVQWNEAQEALKCFDNMQHEGHMPDDITFTCALKACGTSGAIDKGEQIHDKMVHLGLLDRNIVLGNALVAMYSRCGALVKAQQVFNKIPMRDLVTWNTLLAGYAEQGYGEEALECFDSMESEGNLSDAISYNCALKACGSIGALSRGKEIHDKILGLGMLEENIVLGNTVVDMYAKCGSLPIAQQVFDRLHVRSEATWNTLIAGYAQQGLGNVALKCFESMQCEGHSPNAVTFSCILKACGDTGGVAKGEQIHDEVVNLGMLEGNIVLGSALVDMYAKCGALPKAQQVFEELSVRDVATWTAVIAGYAKQEQGEEALKWFDSMQHEGLSPNVVTFTCALKACGSIKAVTKGEQIHDKIVDLGMLEKNTMLGNSLVTMYARCGELVKAQQVFDKLLISAQDVVTWTALIAGYAMQGQGEKALECFDSMQCGGHSPDAVSFTCALNACGSIGAITKGEQIYDIIANSKHKENMVLGNALMDMYARCGALSKAQQVFNELPEQNVVTWTTLIAGHAQQGQCEEASYCFYGMQSKQVRPTSATLVCMLHVCSQLGIMDQAEMYLMGLSTKYGIVPDVEHYCCIVDLFARAGRLDRALIEIEKMSSADCLPVWLVLLGACRKWGDMKMGTYAFEHVLRLDKTDPASYVCLANIYEAAGMCM